MNNRVALFGLLLSSALAVSTAVHAAPAPAPTVSHAPAKASGVLVTISDGGKLLSSFTVRPGEVSEDTSHEARGYVSKADIIKGEGGQSFVTLTPGTVNFGSEYRGSISELRDGSYLLNVSWNQGSVDFKEVKTNGVSIQLPDIRTQKGYLTMKEPFTGTKKVGNVTVDFHKL